MFHHMFFLTLIHSQKKHNEFSIPQLPFVCLSSLVWITTTRSRKHSSSVISPGKSLRIIRQGSVIFAQINQTTGNVATEDFQVMKKQVIWAGLQGKLMHGDDIWYDFIPTLSCLSVHLFVKLPSNPSGPSGYDCESKCSQRSYIIAGGMLELCRGLLDHFTRAHARARLLDKVGPSPRE